ncbi:hypothetical protein [Hymenobacter coccineus]|uniref:DUF1963 domain-containing protein n=1 Tax=Hymenobacter coccineus TaxID=1908235 RepID=A0A1G1SSI1_9BACT|nr:hypothetical protein [Hymenobacter coccineus]OGX81561.1 hypothetical protein BEN49_15445 [Hymenobacter coccineus]
MSPQEIRAALAWPAVAFTTGGFQPTYSATESWLGHVYLGLLGETLPLDAQGRPMWPLLQLVLANLSAVPTSLAGTQALTVFVSPQLPVDTAPAPNGQNWLLREYRHGAPLVTLAMPCPSSPLKPFPLQAGPLLTDYPVWDGGGADHLVGDVMALKRAGTIASYYDLVKNHHGHKLGGWPTFCQLGIDFSAGFEFVLQIASDAQAQLNVVDSGTIFLAKNVATGAWEFYCDFY